MKKLALALVCLIALALSAAAVSQQVASAPLEAPQPAAQSHAEANDALLAGGEICADPFTVSHWHCPYWAPRCFRDSNCDSYCGTPGWGVCLDGCCACLG